MIIRRRHTANFTTIGNDLFNDERLKADEIGIIGYLLSRPHDWEVRRPQLGKRFAYGRDAIKRVLFSAMRHGWIVAEKTRLSDGRFHTIYEVRDGPGPELSDDEIRRALSLGSGEADETESEGLEGSSTDPPATPQPATGEPATGEPATGEPATGKAYVVSKEESTKYGFTKNESTKIARGFSSVIEKWPSENVLSRVTAEAALASLTDKDFIDCNNGIEPYLADRRAAKLALCDLTTFIRQRRWERFSEKAAISAQMFAAKPYTPQWYRWREFYIASGQPVTWMNARAEQGREWTTSAEWPPPMPKKDEDSSAA